MEMSLVSKALFSVITVPLILISVPAHADVYDVQDPACIPCNTVLHEVTITGSHTVTPVQECVASTGTRVGNQWNCAFTYTGGGTATPRLCNSTWDFIPTTGKWKRTSSDCHNISTTVPWDSYCGKGGIAAFPRTVGSKVLDDANAKLQKACDCSQSCTTRTCAFDTTVPAPTLGDASSTSTTPGTDNNGRINSCTYSATYKVNVKCSGQCVRTAP